MELHQGWNNFVWLGEDGAGWGGSRRAPVAGPDRMVRGGARVDMASATPVWKKE